MQMEKRNADLENSNQELKNMVELLRTQLNRRQRPGGYAGAARNVHQAPVLLPGCTLQARVC